VVIGGLFSSTITTLYLLPLFYYHLERRRHG
jgi:multidrug efflux pump subunit AcrB